MLLIGFLKFLGFGVVNSRETDFLYIVSCCFELFNNFSKINI